MRLRSLDDLRLDRSWKRVLHRVRADVMDVPDRLPFEVAARMWGDAPGLSADHQVQLIHRVPGTKRGHATARPFVRVHPADLLLYQALVDHLRNEIESALGSNEEVIGYRLSPVDEDDPIAGSPRWGDFKLAQHQMALGDLTGYVIEGDIASYFLNIDVGELERRLLEVGCNGNLVRDLGALLSAWHAQGIRGLPQGVFPSSALANFYLAPLDDLLRSKSVQFARYMDDVAVLCSSYSEARELLDEIEDLLYEDGLSLGGGKSAISRSETVLLRLTPEEGIEEFIASLEQGDYAPDEDEIEEIRTDQLCEIFDAAVAALDEDKYHRNELAAAYRQLGRRKHSHALDDTPQVLLRIPGLTSAAARYLESVATPEDREAVAEVLSKITTPGRFHRAQEWLHILRAIQVVPDRAAADLTERLAGLAANHEHPLLRARALLAWGRQSDPADFDAADRFFEGEARPWLGYAFVAIQGKDRSAKDDRYARWSSEGRGLAWLAESIQAERFSWKRI